MKRVSVKAFLSIFCSRKNRGIMELSGRIHAIFTEGRGFPEEMMGEAPRYVVWGMGLSKTTGLVVHRV